MEIWKFIQLSPLFMSPQVSESCYSLISLIHLIHNQTNLNLFISFLIYVISQAIFTYWFTSNVLSLAQVGVMRIPGVKDYLGIPAPIVPVKPDPSVNPGTFMENLRAGKYIFLKPIIF